MASRDALVLLCCLGSVSCATVISGGEDLDTDGDDSSRDDGSGGEDDDGSPGIGGNFSTGGNSGNSTGGTTGSGGNAASGGNSAAGGTTAGVGGTEGGTSLFFDDFESGDGEWTKEGDGWEVSSDGSMVLSQPETSSDIRIASAGDVSWGDQYVQARVKVLAFPGSSTSYYVALYARYQDADNHYFVALQSNGDFKIKKRAGGSESSISSSASGVDVTPGTWYTIQFRAVGSMLTVYLDGSPLLQATDASLANGSVAVGTRNGTAVFDDVSVTTPE